MRAPMIISCTAAKFLFAWYFLIIICGLYFLFSILLIPDILEIEINLNLALSASIGAALISSSLFYIRRLYKELFAQPLLTPGGDDRFVKLATIFYFVSRPFFAALFAILVVVTSATFIHTTTAHGTKLSAGFLLFSVLLSTYGSAVTGRFVTLLESLGLERLKNFGGIS